MHGRRVAHYRLRPRCTFRSDDIVTVFGLFFGAAITGPVEVHGNRARTGQGLGRDRGTAASSIGHINKGVIV